MKKLNKNQVKNILIRRQKGEEYSSIAKDFPVSTRMVALICRGKYWCDDDELNAIRENIPDTVKMKKYRRVNIEMLGKLYHDGLSIKEIANKMGFTRNTISTVIVRENISKTRPQNTNRKGEDHNQAKLTEKDVMDILELRLEGELTQKEIGELYGVTPESISNICTGKSWNHPEMKGIRFLRQKLKLAGISHRGRHLKK